MTSVIETNGRTKEEDLKDEISSTKGLSRGQLKRLKQKKKLKSSSSSTKNNSNSNNKTNGTINTNGNDQSSEEKNEEEEEEEEDDERKESDKDKDKEENEEGSRGSMMEIDNNEEGDEKKMIEIYSEVFARFQSFQSSSDLDQSNMEDKPEDPNKGEVIYSDDDMPSDGDSDSNQKNQNVSKRKQRKLSRLTVAELKRLVKKPEVVEWVDVTAQDPKLLVQLKSYRNTVPIPIHWSQKRDYLQGKRGIEKPQFQLPSYIADTGISSQRDAIKEKESEQSLRQKTRERVQPKMGKIDIDYQKLHDAFFKYQVPPPMTSFGEMYYEGKEFETKLKEKRPGDLSEDLKEALSIPPLAPPPWLIAMQRYGPPPSYPNLKIPGLNSPIPEGAQWGYHPGGWGKPPTDEFGRPLYGDVFGQAPKFDNNMYGEAVSKDLWGELQSEEEDSAEEESEEESEEGESQTGPSTTGGDGLQTPTGLETPSGLASITSTVPGGLETPDFLELRKQRKDEEFEESERINQQQQQQQQPKSLYQVISEKDNPRGSNVGFMGSEKIYDVRGISQHGHNVSMLGQEDRGTKRKANNGGVEVSLDVSEIEGLTEEQLKKMYEEESKKKNRTMMVMSNGGSVSLGSKEDLSDLVIEENVKRKNNNNGNSSRDGKDGGRNGVVGKDKEKFKF